MSKFTEYKVITDSANDDSRAKVFEAKERKTGINTIINLDNSGLFSSNLKGKPTKIIVKKETAKKAERKQEDDWEYVWEKEQEC